MLRANGSPLTSQSVCNEGFQLKQEALDVQASSAELKYINSEENTFSSSQSSIKTEESRRFRSSISKPGYEPEHEMLKRRSYNLRALSTEVNYTEPPAPNFMKKEERMHLQSLRENVCHQCGKKYSRAAYLTKHLKRIHEPVMEYVCRHCNKIFGQPDYLARHIRGIHEGKQPYRCEICGRKYSQKNDLRNHVDGFHNGSTDFICRHCGNSYCNAYYVNKHIKCIHEGIKPYACENCGKTYSQKRDLRNHVDGLHKGFRWHVYQRDQKAFSLANDPSNLINPVYKGRTPHLCNICGKTFTRRGNRDIHVKKIHMSLPSQLPCKKEIKLKQESENVQTNFAGIRHKSGEETTFGSRQFSVTNSIKLEKSSNMEKDAGAESVTRMKMNSSLF